jgi:small-conductance mechanosensitive channel
MPQLPANYVDVGAKLIVSVVILVLTLVVHRAATSILKTRVPDPSHMHTLRMLVRNAVFFFGTALILLVWLGVGSNFTVAMGILGAGIAFASQEVVGSFVGYVNIVTGNMFRIGDRVRIGSVVGDVLDITLLRTTVMEIGEWVKADQYTGRVVSIANRVVFSDPLFNYTQHWPYLWDEITIPITYNSDWRHAGEIMMEHGAEYSSHLLEQARTEFAFMMKRLPVHDTPVEPVLYITMTDNWIEMTLRYVVDARARREVKGKLHQELLRHFEAEDNVTVASATFEIVGFPPLRSDA